MSLAEEVTVPAPTLDPAPPQEHPEAHDLLVPPPRAAAGRLALLAVVGAGAAVLVTRLFPGWQTFLALAVAYGLIAVTWMAIARYRRARRDDGDWTIPPEIIRTELSSLVFGPALDPNRFEFGSDPLFDEPSLLAQKPDEPGLLAQAPQEVLVTPDEPAVDAVVLSISDAGAARSHPLRKAPPLALIGAAVAFGVIFALTAWQSEAERRRIRPQLPRPAPDLPGDGAAAAAAREPVATSESPDVAVESGVLERPVAAAEQPVATVEQLVGAVEQPVAGVEQPVAAVEQPVAAVETNPSEPAPVIIEQTLAAALDPSAVLAPAVPLDASTNGTSAGEHAKRTEAPRRRIVRRRNGPQTNGPAGTG